jgi:serine/threonine protein kinase
VSDVDPPLDQGMELAPGYEVRFHVARSRVLDVYDVWSRERDTHCIAKALRPDRLREAKPRRRLYREGRILLGMTHPNIVRAYEMIAGPSPVLVLEPLTGGSLDHALREGGPLEPAVVAELGVQLCSAMHYVHGRGLVHGDLKPANVMGDRGFAKVIDFSLARAPGRGHAGRGTEAYLAPEQARGGLVTGASDVWGIGAVLYAALAGRAPFPVVDGAPRYPQLTHRADRVQEHRPLPAQFAELDVLVAACLDPDARARPTVGELADGLDELAEDDDGVDGVDGVEL